MEQNTTSTFQTPTKLHRDFVKSLNDYNYEHNTHLSMADVLRASQIEFIEHVKTGKKWEKQKNY